VSPVLANVFLHYVLNDWFAREVQPRLKGRAFQIRYADDAVIGFTDEADARRVLAVLPKRFGKYGLRLHPEKTRLVRFQRPPRRSDHKRPPRRSDHKRPPRRSDHKRPPRRSDHKRPPSDGGPGTFELLGFTHYWGLSRRGNWVVKRKTAPSRFTRALRTISRWCRLHRHDPLAEQQQILDQKLRGHFAYYGITPNFEALDRFGREVTRIWHKWLGRRRRDGVLPWAQMARLLEHYPLPRAAVVHSVYRQAAKPVT
jgi:hypothetical protein